MSGLHILLFGLMIDRLVGDPDWLWRRLPHPVVGFGKVIDVADKALNRPSLRPIVRRWTGALFLGGALLLVAALGFVLHWLFAQLRPIGFVAEVLLVAVFLAHKSLADHVGRVAVAYRAEGASGARLALSMIVGRDTSQLEENGLARGAIETLAENFSDGVVAPAFSYALAGLPGLLAYKFLNTADSMIGHKTPHHLHFGWASARLDDLANWLPSRLSVVFVALASLSGGRSAVRQTVRCALRDAGLHRSPNAGWPEAAFAGALDLQLGGPRSYAGEGVVAAPFINASGRATASMDDVKRALMLFAWCGNVFIALVLCLIVIL
ncbi:MAG: adenosylcobinamide-phosphate synthase CbiB [Pseudomonadota bacterium]